MKLLFLDFETVGNDKIPESPTEVACRSIEVGEGRNPTRIYTELGRYESLIWNEDYPKQSLEIVELTGITDEMLRADGKDPQTVFGELHPYLLQADYILAHNAAFDRGIFEDTCKRLHWGAHPSLEWICTWQDVPYPAKYKCKKLAHLALDHGMKMDGRELHRAMNDVLLLSEFITTQYDIEDILAYRAVPWAYLRANFPPPWEDGARGKNFAQKLGYGWTKSPGTQGPEFPQAWIKRVKENQIEAEKLKIVGAPQPFKLTRLMPQERTNDENSKGS